MAAKTNGTASKQVRTGRLNQRKRKGRGKGITPEGRQRLRETALRNRPREHSTGPKTAKGKLLASQNGRYRQTNEMSRREVRLELSEVSQLLVGMAESRQLIFNEE